MISGCSHACRNRDTILQFLLTGFDYIVQILTNDNTERDVDCVVGSSIMPDNIVTNQGKQPKPETWVDPALSEQSIYVIDPIFSLILEYYL